MTVTSQDGEGSSTESVSSLLELHHHAGTFGGLPIDLLPTRRADVVSSIRAVAATAEVTPSAKVDALRALAAKDFPGMDVAGEAYDNLAGAIADEYGIDADQLLSDVKAEAQGDERFEATASGQALPHHVTLRMDDLCSVRTVMVNGLRATWIFSEFETDAPFETVAAWVKPDNWPKRGPMLFKGMSPADNAPAVELGGLDLTPHWGNLYLEDVQIIDRLRTYLQCYYFERPAEAVGMTYELDRSVDDQINVDRGFLLVNDLGDTRHVKALKIVGFTDPAWTDVARFVCPLWTDWVRQAAEGGTTTGPLNGSSSPGTGHPGGGNGGEGGHEPEPGKTKAVLQEWVDFFAEGATNYTEMVGDVAGRVLQGGYQLRDAAQDSARFWSQVAKDWAKAWAFGYETVEHMADEGLDSITGPPGSDSTARLRGDPVTRASHAAARAAAGGDTESAVVPIPGGATRGPLTHTALTAIDEGHHVIAEGDVAVEPTMVTKDVPGVRITATTTHAPAGFYVGDVTVGGQKRPVQLYVSRARSAP